MLENILVKLSEIKKGRYKVDLNKFRLLKPSLLGKEIANGVQGDGHVAIAKDGKSITFNRLGEVFDVKVYNAVKFSAFKSRSITDTEALQAAIDDASGEGIKAGVLGIVLIDRAGIEIPDCVLVHDNVVLVGRPNGGTVVHTLKGSPVFRKVRGKVPMHFIKIEISKI